MTTIFEISIDLLQLQEDLDTLEGLPDEQAAEIHHWFTELLEAKEDERDRKIDNYCALIAETEARAAARKLEAKRIADRARKDENRAKHLKAKLQNFFECHELTSLETGRYQVRLSKNGGKLPVILEEAYSVLDLDEEFVQVSKSPNLGAIREALEAGQELDFAHLGERGKCLRIK